MSTFISFLLMYFYIYIQHVFVKLLVFPLLYTSKYVFFFVFYFNKICLPCLPTKINIVSKYILSRHLYVTFMLIKKCVVRINALYKECAILETQNLSLLPFITINFGLKWFLQNLLLHTEMNFKYFFVLFKILVLS